MAILDGHRVTKSFGGLTAVHEVDFEIEKGEIFALIGPNGSGKTTLLNLINGIFPLSEGEIRFLGQRLNGLQPYQITRMGIGRAFQIVRAFEGMTVEENVLVGGLFGTRKCKDIRTGMKEVERVLDFVRLGKKKDAKITEITIADKKRLELARALVMNPKLLLLDEVMAGLNPREIEDLMKMIIEINREGITVLMIEHVMKAVMGISTRVMVFQHGRRIALGSPREISENKEVITSYLGERFVRRQAEQRGGRKNTWGRDSSGDRLSKETGGNRLNPLFKTQDLQAGYGDIPALWDISLEVGNREVIGLLGSNGAGKTTLLNAASGMVPSMRGTIHFLGKEITLCNPTRRVEMGIIQIPEGRLLFSGLTIKQNLRLGAFARKGKPNLERELETIFHLFPRLAERKNQLAGTLSGGEQQMCAIGRGLMADPRLLLIDELSLGLAPLVVDHIMDALKRAYQARDLSIIIVEQDVELGLEFSHRAYVLETGRIVKQGSSRDLAADPEIRKAYLGI